MRIRSSRWLRVAPVGAAIAAFALPSVASPTIQFATTYQAIPSVASAASVRALDVNGDGILDLVVVGSSNAIWFHRGLAGGGYAPAAPLISFPGAVVLWDAGDINNDGKLDFVVADVTKTAWSVLGNGDGTFQAPRAFLTLFSGACLQLADLDGDGRLDVVAAAAYGPLYTMKGLGDGRFQLTSAMPARPVFPVDLAIADFDGDSIVDVMAANLETNSLDFFHGLPGGLLDMPVAIPMPGQPTSVSVGDLDEDGLPDVMVVNAASSTYIASVVYGAPAGTQFGRIDLPAGGLRSLVAIDLDGDGHPELVAAEANLYGDQVVAFGRTAPRAYTVLRDYAAGRQPQSTVSVDTNGDGRRDIVVCNPARSQLAVLRGHGGLNFGDGEEIHTVASMSGLDVGDVNGDHIPDVVAVQSGTARVAGAHPGAGDGTFLAMISTVGPIGCCGHEAARLVDLNGDGRLDLVGLLGFYDAIDIVLGDGLGHFATGSNRPLGSEPHSSMAIADFNGDGRPDVAVACDAGIAICLSSSTGSLGTPTFVGGSAKFVATADFDRDGRADLIATNSAVDYDFGSQISVYLGRGDGTFAALPTFYGGYRPTTFAVGDVNNDGIPDLAIGNYGDPSIAVFLGAGHGTFVADTVIAGVRATSIEFADLDADGKQDLVATVPDAAGVYVWPGQGGGNFGSPLIFGTRNYPDLLRVTDLNHDGLPDLVVGHMYKDVVDVLMNQTAAYPVPTPILLSLVSAEAEDGRVRLDWFSADAVALNAKVYRRTENSDWQSLGDVVGDGTGHLRYVDRAVSAGVRYAYRLGYVEQGPERFSSETWVEVPALRLALEGLRPNPAVGELVASFTLPSGAPARLQLLDVTGRVWLAREVGSLGAGTHLLQLSGESSVPAGIYWLRLIQSGRSLLARGVVVR